MPTRHALFRPRPCLTAAAILALAGPAGPAAAGEFDDAWFFRGAERPAALKNLEGKPAPALSLESWIGDATSLEQLRGKVVVVDFWATWCGPCMAAIPKNVEMVKEYGDQGLVFLGVHDSKNGWDKADSVVNDKGINYPVARDTGDQASVKAYGLSFWPTYVVIDRHGVVRAAGLVPDKVGDVVRVLLAEDGPAVAAAPGAAEFPVDWYIGGAKRPARLAKLEGKRAPKLAATEWLGDAVPAEMRTGRVTVVRFLAPWSRRSREALPAWSKTARELSKQGVVFIGVSDHLAELDKVEAMLAADTGEPADSAPPFPIARDAAPPVGSRVPLGATATAFGVRMWPTTVVIDRAGRVRAAGLREDQLRGVIDKLMAEPYDASVAPAAADPKTQPGT